MGQARPVDSGQQYFKSSSRIMVENVSVQRTVVDNYRKVECSFTTGVFKVVWKTEWIRNISVMLMLNYVYAPRKIRRVTGKGIEETVEVKMLINRKKIEWSGTFDWPKADSQTNVPKRSCHPKAWHWHLREPATPIQRITLGTILSFSPGECSA